MYLNLVVKVIAAFQDAIKKSVCYACLNDILDSTFSLLKAVYSNL